MKKLPGDTVAFLGGALGVMVTIYRSLCRLLGLVYRTGWYRNDNTFLIYCEDLIVKLMEVFTKSSSAQQAD